MTKPRLAVGVAALALLGAALAIGDPEPPMARPGHDCAEVGETTVTDGRVWTCTTTTVDSRPRWRTGQLDLPNR